MVFDRDVSDMVSKSIFVSLFICLDFIWIKIVYIDHVIKKQFVQFFILTFLKLFTLHQIQ